MPNRTIERRKPPASKAQFIARILLLAILLFTILSAAFSQPTGVRYRVRAVAADSEASVVVRRPVYPVPELQLPRVFTPNGDGLHDEVVFEFPGYVNSTTDIYNELGLRVLRFCYGDRWDGKGCAMGRYMYLTEAVSTKGDTVLTAGSIHLIR